MTPDEWDDTSWDIQQVYLEGLEQDPEVPLTFDQGGSGGDAGGVFAGLPAGQGPQIRENVDAGVDVIDLSAMRRELEASRRHRPGEGGG
jgi:hypothetical protein